MNKTILSFTKHQAQSTIILLALTSSLLALPSSLFAATQYSKLSIIVAAKQAGKWQTLKSFIAAHDLEDEWQAASYISDDNQAFISATNAVVSAGIATTAEISAFLDASRDFAVPDELFAKYYARAMSNASERVNWHGKVVTNHFDTTARTKTTTYADGFVWTQPFTSVETRSRDEHISAAERKARRDEARRKAAEAAERKRLDRIALLTTNMEAEVTALMAKKRWPDELARIYLQTELNKLQTNDVSMTFSPGMRR